MSNKVKEWVGQRTKTINGVLETADLYGEFNEALATIITDCIKDLNLDSQWISVEDRLPKCIYEHSEWHDNVCYFDGMVSQSVEITDGENWSRGHYQSDGKWHIYDESQHDFLNVDPKEITHWTPMIKLPPAP